LHLILILCYLCYRLRHTLKIFYPPPLYMIYNLRYSLVISLFFCETVLLFL
jgi:hypothetical protein